jgi:hypothetical protein
MKDSVVNRSTCNKTRYEITCKDRADLDESVNEHPPTVTRLKLVANQDAVGLYPVSAFLGDKIRICLDSELISLPQELTLFLLQELGSYLGLPSIQSPGSLRNIRG